LCVLDIEQARAQLVERGVEVSEITSFADGGAYDKFFFLKDPDGNNWAVQEVPAVRPTLPTSSGTDQIVVRRPTRRLP
jgi:hypothetical protein